MGLRSCHAMQNPMPGFAHAAASMLHAIPDAMCGCSNALATMWDAMSEAMCEISNAQFSYFLKTPVSAHAAATKLKAMCGCSNALATMLDAMSMAMCESNNAQFSYFWKTPVFAHAAAMYLPPYGAWAILSGTLCGNLLIFSMYREPYLHPYHVLHFVPSLLC